MEDITLKNILSFAIGNFNYYRDKLNLLPQYKKEQALYRLSVCKNDCVALGKCIYCGCPTARKVFAPESCNNGSRFPNYMEEDKWKEFKKQKEIDGNFKI